MKKFLTPIVLTAFASLMFVTPAPANASTSCLQPTEPNCGEANGAGSWLPDVSDVHYKYYTVHKGDTLWRIAVRSYGNTPHAGQQYRKIMKLNHMHSTTIRVGQTLRLT